MVSSPSAGLRHLRAGVLEHETAGAVGVLAVAGLVAGLSVEGRLLVARDARRPGRCRRTRSSRRTRARSAARSGSAPGPRRSRSHSSGSQRRSRMSNSSVRDAFERSVACSPVSLKTSQESIVPNAASGGTSPSRISHSIFVPEKYGSSTSPVRSRTSGSCPASRSSSQRRAVRRSCQTIARWSGSPVPRSQATTVSRWFVMPMPASPRPSVPAESSASRATARVTSQISAASCSTQPGLGKCCWNSR